MEANTEAIEPLVGKNTSFFFHRASLPFAICWCQTLGKKIDHVWDTGCGNNEMELDNMADEN